jgi:hypothetical protein
MYIISLSCMLSSQFTMKFVRAYSQHKSHLLVREFAVRILPKPEID